jgi:gliding motility-associated-like protein
MKFATNILTFLLSVTVFQSSQAQYITVDDNQTAQELVENVLINSPCANVSNITVSGWAFASGNSYGYFNAGTSTFPFQEGVILSTGRAASAIGPNNSLLSEGPANWIGDNDLQQAIGENNTINATVLEFDFLPLANKVSFEYIFSSEQYLSNPNANQCNFSDGFAFLLKEVGSQQYENLAVVPGTTIPVKITTVRGSGTICPPANEIYFDAFNGQNHPTNFNGQTKILKAEATVTPGVLYHIKLVIADQGNQLYDSAIFLGGGSFKVEIDLGPDRLIATSNPICGGETYTLNAFQSGNNSYQWYKNGVLIPNATNTTYTVSEPGDYQVEVVLNNSACIATGEITIEYTQPPSASNATLLQCDPDMNGIGTFNLRTLDSSITNNDNQLIVTYFPTLSDAENTSNSISNPSTYESLATTIYAVVSNSFGCKTIVAVVLQLSNESVNAPPPYTVCDTDGTNDGLAQFNLATVTPQILNGLPVGLQVDYYPTLLNDYSGVTPLPTLFVNTTPNQQIVYARISNGGDCFDIVPVTLIVNGFSVDFNPISVTFCEGSSTILNAPAGNYTYVWNTGDTSQSIQITNPGMYSVIVTNSLGCSAIQQFNASTTQPPTLISVEVIDFNGANNTITIIYSGNGVYQFSIDGVTFQDSPIFTNVSPGNYLVSAIDLNQCGGFTTAVIVLDYPSFFTPNGDSFNDFWRIKNLNQNYVISIFDRFGKLLKTLSGNNSAWDGTFNGSPLPSSDYWFVLQFQDGKTVKGHFALKR